MAGAPTVRTPSRRAPATRPSGVRAAVWCAARRRSSVARDPARTSAATAVYPRCPNQHSPLSHLRSRRSQRSRHRHHQNRPRRHRSQRFRLRRHLRHQNCHPHHLSRHRYRQSRPYRQNRPALRRRRCRTSRMHNRRCRCSSTSNPCPDRPSVRSLGQLRRPPVCLDTRVASRRVPLQRIDHPHQGTSRPPRSALRWPPSLRPQRQASQCRLSAR